MTPPWRPSAGRDERGLALITVLLVLTLLAVVGAEFSYSMRLEASAVQAYKDSVIGTHLAEAAVEQAMREILADFRVVRACPDDPLTFYRGDGTALPVLPRQNVPLAGGEFTYEISDEESRLNLNLAPPDRVDRLLRSVGLEDKRERDRIIDSIQDWRDANEDYRVNGAESEDTYLKRSPPYRSRNANLDSVRELLQINGFTRENFRLIAPWVTVTSSGQVNFFTASEHVLRAYGLAEAEITLVLQTRCGPPTLTVPPQFGGRGFAATSNVFRIDAEGTIGGRVGARIVAVVQRQAGPAGLRLNILEWSGTQ